MKGRLLALVHWKEPVLGEGRAGFPAAGLAEALGLGLYLGEGVAGVSGINLAMPGSQG